MERLCIPCITFGGLLTLASTAAIASPHLANGGPSWQLIATALFGILLSIIGGYAKGISTRVDALAEACNDLKELVLTQYHNKDDLKGILQELRDGIRRIEEAQNRRHGE